MGDKRDRGTTPRGRDARRTSKATRGIVDGVHGEIGRSRPRAVRSSAARPKRGRTVHGGRDPRLRRGDRSSLTASVSRSGKLVSGEVPGLKSVASATAAPASTSGAPVPVGRSRGRAWWRAEGGHGVAGGQCGDARIGDGRQVVCRHGPELRRQRRAAAVVQLIGVQLEGQTPHARPAARGAISSRVNTPGSQKMSANRASPSRATAGCSSSSSAASQASRPPGASRYSSGTSCAPRQVATTRAGSAPPAANHAQRAQLVRDGQSVPGLDLDRGHTAGEQSRDARTASAKSAWSEVARRLRTEA
jgi:hypothetical protein